MNGFDWSSLGVGISAAIVGYFSARTSRDSGKSHDKRDEFTLLFNKQQESITSLQTQIDKLNKRVDSLSQENTNFRILNSKLQDTNKGLMRENGQLKHENRLLNIDLNDYKNVYGSLKGDNKQ